MKLMEVASLALCLGSLLFVGLASADDNQASCAVAESMAEKAYDRTAVAFNSGDRDAAITYSKSFWNVYQGNESCEFIKYLAGKLNEIGITSSSVVSSKSFQITLPGTGGTYKICQSCKLTQTKPGKSGNTGMQGQGIE